MQSPNHAPKSSIRAKAPLTLAAAVLLGATALTIPFFTSDANMVASAAQSTTQAIVPATGFADLVDAVKPAVVSVQVKNSGYKHSSNRSRQHRDAPDGDMFKRFFEQFGGQLQPQAYYGTDSDLSGPEAQNYDNNQNTASTYQHNCDRQAQEQSWNQQRTESEIPGYQFNDERSQQAYNGVRPGQDMFNANSRRNRQGKRQRHSSNQGSGFIISADGYVVTNNHVVEDGESIEIKMSDGKTYEAKLIGTDPKTDLALLKIDADRTFEFVSFAETTARVGDWVIAVGNPFGLGGSVTTGIVSAKGRDLGAGPYDDYLQIDAPINRGNSGGPTFNLNGKVVGVNTAIFSPTGGNVGIGFAIPASVAREVIEDLKDDGSMSRGWLGVQIQTVTDDIAESLGLDHTKGAMVSMVQDDSPAEKAGLKAGDLVLQVGGAQVENPKDLARKVAAFDPDSEVEFTVFRNGDTVTVTVKLGKLAGKNKKAEAAPEKPTATASLGSLGLSLTTKGDDLVISSVIPDGPAADKGLKAGDRILEVGGQRVKSSKDIEDRIRSMTEKGRKTVLILVRSGGNQKFVAIELDKG